MQSHMVKYTTMHEGDSNSQGQQKLSHTTYRKKALKRKGELPISNTLSPQLVQESKQWAEEGRFEDEHEDYADLDYGIRIR